MRHQIEVPELHIPEFVEEYGSLRIKKKKEEEEEDKERKKKRHTAEL